MAKNKKSQVGSFTKGWEGRVAKTRPPVVLVTWLDACVDSGTCLEVDSGWEQRWGDAGAIMQTTGFLLKKDENWVWLGMERHAERDSGFRRIQQIPVYSVANLEILKK